MKNSQGLRQVLSISQKISNHILMGSGAFCVIFFFGMVVVALLGVLFRYIMDNPFEWTEEIARFLMLIVSFLGINIALRQKEHIAVSAIVELCSPKIARFFDYLSDLLIAFFLVMLLKQGYFMSVRTLMSASSIDISMTWIYIFVPIGALLTLIQLIVIVMEKVFVDLGIVSPEQVQL